MRNSFKGLDLIDNDAYRLISVKSSQQQEQDSHQSVMWEFVK